MATTIAAPILVFLLVAPIAVFAATFQVDWSLTTDYSSWPSKAVNVGDEIVFTYGPSHNVFVVSKTDYANCDTSNPSYSDASGSTTYKLKQEGAVYFICGTPGHCPAMQLQLNVNASSSSSPPSPSSSSSPTPPSAPASPPTPSSSSPTPPSTLASPPSSNTPPTSTADSPPTTSSSSSPPPSPATSSEKNGAACSGLNSLALGLLLVFGTLFLS